MKVRAIGCPLLVSTLFAVGCGSVAAEKGHDDVARIVAARSGYRTRWEKGPPADRDVERWVGELLGSGLTRRSAVEIALVNNPSLRITYEDLGVSQADLVQAGLVSNPTIAGSVGFPLGRGETEWEGSLTESFLDVFLLPLRKKIAKERFLVATLRVAHETLATATETRKAFAAYQAATRLVELRRTIVEATRISADLAERQHDAGNIDDYSLTQELAAREQAELELEREELGRATARESLNRLLGLVGPRTAWRLAESLPEIPSTDPPLHDLENVAVLERLDVSAARKEMILFGNAVDLAKDARYFGLVEVGIHAHQDPDGARLLGPTLSLELPLFDQRQALIARLEAEYRQTRHRLEKVAVQARSEVREAVANLSMARHAVERFKARLLPLRDRGVEQAQLLYNGMQLGLPQLLLAKQAQASAYREYIETVRDYWSARADLEMAVGGRFTRSRNAEVDRQKDEGQ